MHRSSLLLLPLALLLPACGDGAQKDKSSTKDQSKKEGKALEPCHPGCFPPGTLVATSRGPRPIETIRQGDVVTLIDAAGCAQSGAVNSTFQTCNRLVQLHTESGSLLTTDTQPLCLCDGGFRRAGELVEGDRVWRWHNGERVPTRIRGVVPTHRDSEVFNLVVGESAIFVANGFLACGKPPAIANAAGPDWKVGLAQIKITPERPLPMSGYSARTKPFEGVASDLYVKAMVLEDADGGRGVLVTSDLLGFSAAVAEPICARIHKQLGIERGRILLNSAHTHAGPTVGLRAPAKDTGGEAQRILEYTQQLQEKVVQVVAQAAERLQPARLSHGAGVAHFVMNRREFTPTGVILGVNPRGLADRSVPVLRVDTLDGKPLAILFGAAVHNTTLGPDNYQISGDYAGYAQSYVQEKHPKVQAMFMLGCAGDANPYPRGTMELARKHGHTLGEEVCRVMDGKLRPVRGPLRIAFDRANVPLQTALSHDQLKALAADKRNAKAFAAAQLLALVDKGEKVPTHYSCPLTVWQFGDDLTLVGLSGEVVVDYVTLLEKEIGPNQLWVAGYCNDVFGYLPSARVLSEGGYETRGLYSGGAGFFAPNAQEVVVQSVRELAKKAGRKLPADDGKLEAGFTLLFNGKNLDGWKEASNKKESLQGKTEAFKGRFKVVEGKLVIDPAVKGDLHVETTREFAKDVHVKFDFKPGPKCNNDVFLRGTKFDIVPGNKENMTAKEGEWSTCEIVVIGDKVEHKINGVTTRTSKTTAKSSPLRLRAEFGAMEIKNLRVKE